MTAKPPHVLIAEGLGWFDCREEPVSEFSTGPYWTGCAHWLKYRALVPYFDSDWASLEFELRMIKEWQGELERNFITYSRYDPSVLFVNPKMVVTNGTETMLYYPSIANATEVIWYGGLAGGGAGRGGEKV